MFHTLITLSYTIPGIYLFFRIWYLFIAKKDRFRYFVIFAFLYFIYPFSNLIGENETGAVVRVLETVSGYLLPFFLYLFLSVLLTDLLLLINLVFKILPKETVRERRFRNRLFVGIISLSAAIVIAGIINFNTIRTSRYQVAVDGRSSEIPRLRIAFISDFHLEERIPVRVVEKFVREISVIEPDLVLFGGDIVEGGRMGNHIVKFEDILRRMETTYGVYGVMGNHDGFGRKDVESFFKKSGIVILKDSIVVKDSSFVLAGRKDSRVRDRKSAMELISAIQDDLPVILLDHRPTEFDEISKTRADIVLSGHTHHGQLFPINLITRSVYELSYGYMKNCSAHFFVSSGIRLWGPPVRTTAKSEILVIDTTFN